MVWIKGEGIYKSVQSFADCKEWYHSRCSNGGLRAHRPEALESDTHGGPWTSATDTVGLLFLETSILSICISFFLNDVQVSSLFQPHTSLGKIVS